MTCPHCNSSWEASNKANTVVKNCPFCQGDLSPKPVLNQDSPEGKLQAIVQQFQPEIYLEHGRLKSLVADFFGIDKRTVKLLGKILDNDGGKTIYQNRELSKKDFDLVRRKLILKIAGEEFVPEHIIEEGVNLLCAGLGITVEVAFKDDTTAENPVPTPSKPKKTAASTTKKAPAPTTDFVIEGTVLIKYIGRSAHVTIPESVKVIGEKAFYECQSLTSVTIPNSVTEIGFYAFQDCRSLTSVTIPDSVTEIDAYVFGHCTSLTSVTIPDSVTVIGECAFSDCKSLTSVTIPDSVTVIGFIAFGHCTSLTSVTIPDSVTVIGQEAFSHCESLTSVTIPDSVTCIGVYTFSDCKSLTSVTIPNSVTTIREAAFNSCVSLTSVTIPDSVIEIEERAFNGCASLTSLTFLGEKPEIDPTAFEGTPVGKEIKI